MPLSIQISMPDGTKQQVTGPASLAATLQSLGFDPSVSPVVARTGMRSLSLDDWVLPGDHLVLDWKVRGG